MATTDSGHFEHLEMWVVEGSAGVLLAALRTDDNNLVMSTAKSEAAVHTLAGAIGSIPGVIGPIPWVDVFCKERPENVERSMRQGIYELREVTWPSHIPGTARLAGESDRALLERWGDEFQLAAHGSVSEGASHLMIDQRLKGPPDQFAAWIFEDDQGTPVCMSGNTGPTPNGVRVGPVYTPAEHRGNGYASALVAAQSQWLLDAGRKLCFLYTDMANPTSNAIYRRIGYRKVADSADIYFIRSS